MLKNAYLLAKIGADTAENEQHIAEILPIGRRVADRLVLLLQRSASAVHEDDVIPFEHALDWERNDPKSRLAIPIFFYQILQNVSLLEKNDVGNFAYIWQLCAILKKMRSSFSSWRIFYLRQFAQFACNFQLPTNTHPPRQCLQPAAARAKVQPDVATKPEDAFSKTNSNLAWSPQ